jgi:uncharacterized membrane protein YecN with MAPEG domain
MAVLPLLSRPANMAIQCRRIEGETAGMPVFFVCAGLLGLLAVALSLQVGRLRGQKRISLGDGGDPEMVAAIRAHGNFMEFTPLLLLLIYLGGDSNGFRVTAILSVLLLVARVLHAGGMLDMIPKGRFLGAVGTMLVLLAASVLLVFAGFGLQKP